MKKELILGLCLTLSASFYSCKTISEKRDNSSWLIPYASDEKLRSPQKERGNPTGLIPFVFDRGHLSEANYTNPEDPSKKNMLCIEF